MVLLRSGGMHIANGWFRVHCKLHKKGLFNGVAVCLTGSLQFTGQLFPSRLLVGFAGDVIWLFCRLAWLLH
jgi:hypothetical protein